MTRSIWQVVFCLDNGKAFILENFPGCVSIFLYVTSCLAWRESIASYWSNFILRDEYADRFVDTIVRFKLDDLYNYFIEINNIPIAELWLAAALVLCSATFCWLGWSGISKQNNIVFINHALNYRALQINVTQLNLTYNEITSGLAQSGWWIKPLSVNYEDRWDSAWPVGLITCWELAQN